MKRGERMQAQHIVFSQNEYTVTVQEAVTFEMCLVLVITEWCVSLEV